MARHAWAASANFPCCSSLCASAGSTDCASANFDEHNARITSRNFQCFMLETKCRKPIVEERNKPGALFYNRAKRKDRKSTRLNSSHVKISYAVFCLKKKK